MTGSFLICFTLFNFPFSLTTDFTWEADGILVQAQIQSIIDGGIFGRSDHLGFPFGFTQWNNPQISYLHSLVIWLTAKFLPISTYGYLILITFTTIIINSLLLYYLSTLFIKNDYINYVFLIFGLLIPYSLYALDHPHVITYYIYIFIIIMILKIDYLSKKSLILFVLVLLATNMFQLILISFVLSLLVGIFTFYLIFDKSYKPQIFNLFKIYGILIFVFGLNISNHIAHSTINGQNGRATYQSDLFAGKFTDILLSSPFLNQIIPNLEILKTGSTDARQIGLPLMISFFLGLILLIIYPLLKVESFSLKVLFSLLLISLFTFITGGFGNLQASFFVILGQISPMRSWSRLLIFTALISLTIIFSLLKNNIRLKTFYTIMTFTLILSVLDFIRLDRDSKFNTNQTTIEEAKFLSFIETNLQPCPILQIPIDTYFIPQSAWDQGWRYYWNGMIPYIVLPQFKWTAATYVDSPGWKELTKIPTVVDNDFVASTKGDYCAIVFDSNFSQYQIDRQASLSANPGVWPGLKVATDLKPNYSDSRYLVYLTK